MPTYPRISGAIAHPGACVKGYPVDRSWLVKRLEKDDPDWSYAIGQLLAKFRAGDEFWLFDEPAPPGVNAGAIGVALVRSGKPIATAIGAIH